MTRFRDGPAAGKLLNLARVPLLLRVVIAPDGKVDAIDQFDDVAQPDEAIHVYRRVPGTRSSGFIDYTDQNTGRRRGRPFVSAEYVLAENQPDDATARDEARWRAWCYEQWGEPK